MGVGDFKYDVAFSFLAQDETIATELNDFLQDRVRTFLYSKKQGEIAGTDGEKTFNVVFGEQARLVVVLYRDGWGQSPWTRIEETAIRNRAYEHGYEFVKFIPLDDPPSVPKWLPRTQLWVGMKRWGVAGAASIIEARIEELGGEPHEESVQDRATRLERQLKFEKKRNDFLNSPTGVDAANKEYEFLRLELERLVNSIKVSISSISLTYKSSQNHIVILGFRNVLSIGWYYRYSNTLYKSHLDVLILDGHPHFPGIMVFEEPKIIQSLQFDFDLLPSGEVCWRSSTSVKRDYSTIELASFILKNYMDQASDN